MFMSELFIGVDFLSQIKAQNLLLNGLRTIQQVSAPLLSLIKPYDPTNPTHPFFMGVGGLRWLNPS
jgi:hypothetical protein